jgi:hypothetical protein
MACAKCDFYTPKQSTAALLLEAKKHLLRLLQEIRLGEAERAAVEDGITAYEDLLSRIGGRTHSGEPHAAADRRRVGADYVVAVHGAAHSAAYRGLWLG